MCGSHDCRWSSLHWLNVHNIQISCISIAQCQCVGHIWFVGFRRSATFRTLHDSSCSLKDSLPVVLFRLFQFNQNLSKPISSKLASLSEILACKKKHLTRLTFWVSVVGSDSSEHRSLSIFMDRGVVNATNVKEVRFVRPCDHLVSRGVQLGGWRFHNDENDYRYMAPLGRHAAVVNAAQRKGRARDANSVHFSDHLSAGNGLKLHTSKTPSQKLRMLTNFAVMQNLITFFHLLLPPLLLLLHKAEILL